MGLLLTRDIHTRVHETGKPSKLRRDPFESIDPTMKHFTDLVLLNEHGYAVIEAGRYYLSRAKKVVSRMQVRYRVTI
jgi:hypothetical protein